jgi:hypothetical protein
MEEFGLADVNYLLNAARTHKQFCHGFLAVDPWACSPAREAPRGRTGCWMSAEEVDLRGIDDAVVSLEFGGRHVLTRPREVKGYGR